MATWVGDGGASGAVAASGSVVARTSNMLGDLERARQPHNPQVPMTRVRNKRSRGGWDASHSAIEALGVEQEEAKPMSGFEDIREHMEIIGADGVHLGTVDRIEENRIKMIRADSGVGHEGEHHYIPRGLVAEVEGDKVRL